MIPFLGCKQSFAKQLLANILETENFYDLFGGGGSITEAAVKCKHNGLLGDWHKWKNIYYNEINKGVYLLNKEIWSGKFDFEFAKKQTPTKERYYAERRKPTAFGAFVSFVWSFGNNDECFVYGENKCSARKDEVESRIRRIQKSPILPAVQMTNKDYRKVTIKPNSVVYCDIPYHVCRKHYGIKFDWLAFYDWAAYSKFPVYFSEYDCYDIRFEMVWQKKVISKINRGNGIYRTEKLFWNRRGL